VSEHKPTAADLARDLHADLRLCDGASPGPWGQGDLWLPWLRQAFALLLEQWPDSVADLERDFALIAAARDGWPAAIRRALAAEARAVRLQDRVERLHRGMMP
jgi:hypothetical protein